MAETNTEHTLTVYGRTRTGKSGSFRLRADNLVPAVVYGPKLKTGANVVVKPADIQVLYKKVGLTTLVTLKTEDGAPSELNGTKILFKEIQVHPIKPRIIHVDLHQLDLERKVRVTVPLKFTGKAKGVAEGGIMSIQTREVEIKALPLDIPSSIEVDVSDLDVNDSIHVEELAKKFEANKKYEFIFESNFGIVSVLVPEEEVAATPAAGGDAAAAAPGAPGAPAAAGAAAPAAAGAKAPAAGAKAPAAPAKK